MGYQYGYQIRIDHMGFASNWQYCVDLSHYEVINHDEPSDTDTPTGDSLITTTDRRAATIVSGEDRVAVIVYHEFENGDGGRRYLHSEIHLNPIRSAKGLDHDLNTLVCEAYDLYKAGS